MNYFFLYHAFIFYVCFSEYKPQQNKRHASAHDFTYKFMSCIPLNVESAPRSLYELSGKQGEIFVLLGYVKQCLEI